MTWGDLGRTRNKRVRRRIHRHKDEFINPYPWMSVPEAKVHLWLEFQGVPFSWRNFDGKDKAPHLALLLKDFHPEFTLREYKIAILIIGGFFGTLPGVLDRVSLGRVLLEEDGWKVAVLFESDIMNDLESLMAKELPRLLSPNIKGRPRPNPYGPGTFMEDRRKVLQATALRRKQKWTDGEVQLEERSRARFNSRRRPVRASRRRFRRLGS